MSWARRVGIFVELFVSSSHNSPIQNRNICPMLYTVCIEHLWKPDSTPVEGFLLRKNSLRSNSFRPKNPSTGAVSQIYPRGNIPRNARTRLYQCQPKKLNITEKNPRIFGDESSSRSPNNENPENDVVAVVEADVVVDVGVVAVVTCLRGACGTSPLVVSLRTSV